MLRYYVFEQAAAKSPWEASVIRKAVRKNIFYGADLIKVVADNSPYHYSLEEIRAAVVMKNGTIVRKQY